MSDREKRRALNRLGRLCRRLGKMIEDGSFFALPDDRRRGLVQRIRSLYASLVEVVPERTLRRVVAAASVVVLGLAACSGGNGGPGNGTMTPAFSAALENPFGLAPPMPYGGWLAVADMDGDGDLDLFAGSYDYYGGGGILYFFENTGSSASPAFGAAVENPFGIAFTGYDILPAFADLDNDGDQDLLATIVDEYDVRVEYFENTGAPTSPAFTAPVRDPFGITDILFAPDLTDLDGDGDMDILAGAEGYDSGTFAFLENTGSAGAPAFGTPVDGPFGLTSPTDYSPLPAVADLDGDGDLDVLAACYGYYEAGGFYYFQNGGSSTTPSYAAPTRNPFGLPHLDGDVQSIVLADMDGDGDADLLASSYAEYVGAVILYHENTAR